MFSIFMLLSNFQYRNTAFIFKCKKTKCLTKINCEENISKYDIFLLIPLTSREERKIYFTEAYSYIISNKTTPKHSDPHEQLFGWGALPSLFWRDTAQKAIKSWRHLSKPTVSAVIMVANRTNSSFLHFEWWQQKMFLSSFLHENVKMSKTSPEWIFQKL